MKNDLPTAEVTSLSSQIARYPDPEAVIEELERLETQARQDAALLAATNQHDLSFGAKEFVTEVQILIGRLRQIPSGYDAAFAIPRNATAAEAQNDANHLAGLGFRRVIFDGRHDRLGWYRYFLNAGLKLDSRGFAKGVRFLGAQKDGGLIAPDAASVRNVRIDPSLTPIVLKGVNQNENPFVRDYGVLLAAATALLIAYEGKAALLKNPIPLLEQYGLISSGYHGNAFIQSDGRQLFISAVAVQAYLQWRAEQRTQVSA